MRRNGFKILMKSAVAGCLLAGCAARPNGGQQHSLTASSRLDVADAAEGGGDKETAVSMYLAAANEAPGDAAIQLRCAEGLAPNGRVEDAHAVLTRRLKTTPQDMDLLRTLGAVQVMAGNPSQAIGTLAQVLANKPDDMKALVDKAIALDMLHRHDQAQILYRQALARAPDDAAISNDLAVSLLLSGQPAAGERILAPFRDSADVPERIKTNLGIMDAASGQSEEARSLLSTRIDSADLATLTAAINSGSAIARP